MKVLHIAPTPFFADRGCHIRIAGIIAALNRRNVANLLCTYNPGRDIPGIQIDRIAPVPGTIKPEAGPSASKYLADVALFFRVCSILRRWKPDLIHGHLHEGALVGWAARTCFFWRRTPLIFDMQGSLVGELETHGYLRKTPLLHWLFWGIEYLITRMPTHFVCSSQHSAQILGQEFRVPERLISTVPDGVGGPAPLRTPKLVTRVGLGLPEDMVIVVYSGGLQEGKGLATLRRLILESRSQLLPLHFLVIGYPEGSLKEYVEANDLRNICTIVGRVPFEELGDYLSLADIAVDPKEAAAGEASGKILNYMAAGLPVICFGSPGNTDLLGGAGFFTESGTIADFMEKLSYLANRPDERRRMGKAAQARVVGKFSWDCGADSIYEIYGKCLNPP